MEQRILPSEKQSHVTGLDELSNHCQNPPSSTFVSLAQRTERYCSSASSLKLSISWHLLINSPPSPHPAAPVLLPLSGYYYSPKSGKGLGLRAANMICSMIEIALMSTPLSRVPGHIFKLVPASEVPSLPCLPQLLLFLQSTDQSYLLQENPPSCLCNPRVPCTGLLY